MFRLGAAIGRGRAGANSGCHLKIKPATSVSTTSLAAAIGGEVDVALLIDAAYELLGFLPGPWVDVAQQTIQQRAAPDQIGRIFDGLSWHMVHLKHHSNSARSLVTTGGLPAEGRFVPVELSFIARDIMLFGESTCESRRASAKSPLTS